MADETTTTTTAAPTVRFSDEPKVFYPEEVKKKVTVSVPTVIGKQRRSRRERRNNTIALQNALEDAKIKRQQEKFDLIKRFADQLTPRKLITELKKFVSEDMEELGIKEQISGVPNNGEVLFSPVSYCSDCVDRIAAYFYGENMAKNILKNDDDGVEEQVYIKDVKKLAVSFLNMLNIHFYDHITVEAFNNNAMKRGGSKYGVPLSAACLADATKNGGNLYEKLAGKATVCAAFSTGVVMQCGMSELTASSENSFKTHNQLLEENVDPNTIKSGCSCLKSDKWLKKRVTDERNMERLMQKYNNKEEFWRDLMFLDKTYMNWKLEEMEEVDSDEEEKAEMYPEEEEEEVEEDSEVVEFERPEEDVNDYDFRPGNLVQTVENEEDFDKERWSYTRTTSSCLALCRHAPSCVVNAINKARMLESLMLVRLSKDEKEGIASTTPGEYFTVITQPENSLIFSLGATVYEALVRQSDSDNVLWTSSSSISSDANDESRKVIAKAYTTVHTVAAPFFMSEPVCHIDQQNKYGYYKTWRIGLPGNFSGYYNDTSIGWRSELYSRITFSAAETESRGDKKIHDSLLENEKEFVAWPLRIRTRVEGGIVYDDSGDMSGNYLTSRYDEFGNVPLFEKKEREEKMAVTAYANTRNFIAAIKHIKESIGELLTGIFKNQLVELKTLDIERTQAEEAAEGGLTAHETQHLNDIRTNMTQNAKLTAHTIERYGKCLKSRERDLGTMNKYLSYNLKGYTAAASHKSDDNIYAYYL